MTPAVRALLGLAAVLGATAGACALGDLRLAPLACALLLAVACAGALALMGAAEALAAPLVLAGLIAARAIALFGGPSLSDDDHRYVHEGRAQRVALGLPYAAPPAQLLREGRVPPPDDGTTARVNHPDVPAAYPPGTELALAALVGLGDRVGHPRAPLRVALVLADLAVLLILFRRRGVMPAAFVWYGAHPLPISETALAGHLDAFGAALVVFAVLAAARPALAGALVGLAVHVKPIAVVSLAALRGRALVRALIAAAVVAGIVALPHVIAGAPVLAGLVEYGTRWRASPIAFAVLEAPLRPVFDERAARGEYAHLHVSARGVVLENAGAPIASVGDASAAMGARKILVDAGFLARLLAGALVGVALVLLARSQSSPTVRAAAALACAWLLAPALHPWYFLWLVPFAALLRSRGLWALGASAPALYQPVFGYAATGEWHEAVWPRLLVIAAAAVGFVWDARERRED